MLTCPKVVLYPSGLKPWLLIKKQELTHLYGLFAEVHTQIEAWEDEEISLVEYNEPGVRPTSIHRSKTGHKAAVFKLAKGITGTMREAEPEPLTPQAG